jgi:hypothetical protein
LGRLAGDIEGFATAFANRYAKGESAFIDSLRWALDVIDDNSSDEERIAADLFAKHYQAAQVALRQTDPANTPKYLTALQNIAAFQIDGEEIEGEDDPVELSIHDAFEIAREAVHFARAALESSASMA